MKFTKMHGIGNCYLYINCFEETVEDPVSLAKQLSDIHFGVGSDGVVLICPSGHADCKMDIYNADGSRAKMCGNGVRCVGKYIYDRGLVKKDVVTVETLSGVKTLYLNVVNGTVESVRVDMGQPVLEPERIPVRVPGPRMVDRPIQLSSGDLGTVRATGVSMGNPHCVVFFQEELDSLDLEKTGPLFEQDPLFPEGVNTEFIQVRNDHEINMRVWERGSGETWACGTGACAAAVAGVLNGYTGRNVLVHLRGGDLQIEWDESTGHVFMTGPAAFICDGETLTSKEVGTSENQ